MRFVNKFLTNFQNTEIDWVHTEKNETKKNAITLNMLSWGHRREGRHSIQWNPTEETGMVKEKRSRTEHKRLKKC